MPIEEWQRRLRAQYGAEQDFALKNIGEHKILSEFCVTNPASKNTYRVAIRGERPGDNYCSCPDFATNALGTCKHVEFTLAALRKKRGGVRALAAGFQPAWSEVYVTYGLERTVRFRPGIECPKEVARAAARTFDEEGRIRPDAHTHFDAFLTRIEAIDHEVRVYDDALGLVAEMRDQDIRRRKIDAAFTRGVTSPAFKDLLKVGLYPYQREGALFAAKAGRSLIADEMGLGKTIQAIAAAEIMARFLGVERVLVVAPTSLKYQWQQEISRFTDRPSDVIGGQRPARQRQFANPTFFRLVNYDVVHRDLDLIEQWAPDLVILDEAQRIKNWATRVANSVKKIRSPYAIVLTGTPLENRLEELVSIVQFVDRHRLGPTWQFLDRHQIREEDSSQVVGYRDLDRIGETLAPILIRRRKNDVLKQLPGRLEKNFFVPVTEEQWKYHSEAAETVARVVAKWRRFKFLTEADQQAMRVALQIMRMSCNSTYLLDRTTDHGYKADEAATLLAEVAEEPRGKAVVFSSWIGTHELLQARLTDRPFSHVFFHGGLPTRERRTIVDRFREDDACRVFLATDAAGVGLNLQNAQTVINMDLPWNPAVLEQRIGRVHRMGQTQPVRVVNFVAQGTIEEGMLQLLAFKQSLFSGVLDDGEKKVFLGESQLSRFIESVEKVTAQIPDRAPETPAGAEASGNGQAGEPPAEPAPAEDSLARLIRTGIDFLSSLASPVPAGGSPESPSAAPRAVSVERDGPDGRPYLKLSLPEPDVLQGILDGVRALVEGLRR
jgi:superfamily II DNA or RNA helicase